MVGGYGPRINVDGAPRHLAIGRRSPQMDRMNGMAGDGTSLRPDHVHCGFAVSPSHSRACIPRRFVPLRRMNVSLSAPTYDAARERAWHLSVHMAPGYHAWCVHDVQNGCCVALYADKGEDLPHASHLPLRPVSVSFVALPEISTLVPESALTPGSEMLHLKRVHGHLPTGLLRDEPLPSLSARCIYLHDEKAEHRLLSRFPNARSLPLSSVMVHDALAASTGRTVLLMDRSANRLDLVMAHDQQLLLCNTFHATNAEDILYYILLVVEECGKKAEGVHLLTAGTHLLGTEEQLLARYLPKVSPAIGARDPLLRFSGLEASHQFTALLHQYACAS